METRIDFLQWLETDMSLLILMCLDDPSDLIRASTVSHFWRHFVIANGLCKQLCERMFPQLANVVRVIEPSCRRCRTKKSKDVGCSNSLEWKTLARDHRVYGSLFRALTTFAVSDCIVVAISASSTDNYPDESIRNTTPTPTPRDIIFEQASYWSSKGQSDPEVPEKLIYKLTSDFCVITEISVQPFRAYFQSGSPIYSAKFVRFRIGHPKSRSVIERDLVHLPLEQCANDKFRWTYTSQQFPMAQDNHLQKFKLPEPVLCIGGFLQIELLGRVQKQEVDGLLYICVSHVQVIGRSLFPSFDVNVLQPSGKFCLKYYAKAFDRMLRSLSDGSPSATSSVSPLPPSERRIWGRLESLVGYLIHRHGPGAEPNDVFYEDDDSDQSVNLIILYRHSFGTRVD